MNFYDAHLHNIGNEKGGFLVGLEGSPFFDGTLSNAEVARVAAGKAQYKYFHYVTAAKQQEIAGHELLKYHPRREKYTPDEVIASIRLNAPKCVMLDTLNEPAWQAYDYWQVARALPETLFIFAHAGGYLINDFIKICHFQPNVWIDFTLTHTNFGGISANPLPYIDEAILYSLHSPFKKCILLGSDLPFFNQADVVEYYQRLDGVELLNENFERLLGLIEKSRN